MTILSGPMKVLLIFCLAITVSAARCEDADSFQQRGVDALKESQTSPRAIVEAARNFAKAAQAYAAAGEEAKSVEMHSYLYWCKKKMTMEDIDSFLKSGEASLVITLNAAAEQKVEVDAAQTWLDRAEAFALKQPQEHLLIAIRFFEVADRFKGSEISFQAQDRSLKEQTLALGQKAPAKKKTAAAAPPVDTPPEVAIVKQPVPDAAKLKTAEKELRDILKDEFQNVKPEAKLALAKKLMLMSEDPNIDPVTKFVELQEAGELAASGGSVLIALAAARKQETAYLVDAAAVKAALLKISLDAAKTKEANRVVADAALLAIDESIKARQFGALKALATVCDSASARAAAPDLLAQVKHKSACVDELVQAWPAVKTALEKLKADEANPALNLTAGKFVALLEGDMVNGLPLLSKGSDALLKSLADRDISNPEESSQQIQLGDIWWDLAEKDKTKLARLTMLIRAGYWYERSLTTAVGIIRIKLEKRLATIAATPGMAVVAAVDLSGKWTVSWSDHPAYGRRNCELTANGTILVGPREDFGAYKPVTWLVKGKQVIIQFKNGEASSYKLIDKNTFKQEDGGDAVYARKK